VGSATTRFCHPGEILQLFHQQDQQILRLPIAAAVRLHLVDPSSSAVFIIKKYAQIGQSIFFGWFPANLEVPIRLRAIFLHHLPAGSVKSTTSTPTSKVDPWAGVQIGVYSAHASEKGKTCFRRD
jgi:hypothetical protein